MLDAASFISTLQKRQGLQLSCPEEIAYGQKWITTEQLQKLAAPSIHTDPIITKLLDKVPADMRESFSPEQLLALKVALGGRTWGAHALDARWTLKLWRWQYHMMVLAGRNKRMLPKP